MNSRRKQEETAYDSREATHHPRMRTKIRMNGGKNPRMTIGRIHQAFRTGRGDTDFREGFPLCNANVQKSLNRKNSNRDHNRTIWSPFNALGNKCTIGHKNQFEPLKTDRTPRLKDSKKAQRYHRMTTGAFARR